LILDTLSTWYVVILTKVANEINPVNIFLWDTFGYDIGECIRLSILAFIFIVIYVKSDSKSDKVQFTTDFLIIFLFSIWVMVVVNNVYQLFS
jgi:hypothetical protein